MIKVKHPSFTIAPMISVVTFSFSLDDKWLNKYKIHVNSKFAIHKGIAKAGYIHFVLSV